jgi:hypothetical protein
MTSKIAALVLVAFLAAGCSGGGAADQPQGEPTVSTPADETPAPTLTGDFATAVEFTKLVHRDKYSKAAELAVSESPAARYVAHQVLMRKAERINGYYRDPSTRKTRFKPDAAAGSIKITDTELQEVGDESGGDKETKAVYTWHSFTFDQGKLTGWTGKTGPIEKVLWSRTTTDSSRGTRAELKSAYRANGGNLFVVVELSASKGRGFGDATYTARGGYRQTVLEQGAMDVSKGEKTLAYFVFEDAKFGGTLHLPYYDENGSSYGNWEIKLAIK